MACAYYHNISIFHQVSKNQVLFCSIKEKKKKIWWTNLFVLLLFFLRIYLWSDLIVGEEVIFDKTNIHSKSYHLIGVDLRDVKDLDAKLRSINLDFSAPTLFISECVLVYIEYPLAQNMLSWISSTFISALFICYDPVSTLNYFVL